MLIRPVRRPILGPTGEPVSAGGGLPWDGVGGGGAYDPSLEAGYALDWWASDAASITKDGSDIVSSWVDRASALDASQGTTGQRPSYQATGLGGKPAILFERANSEHLEWTTFADASTDWTFYLFCDVKSVPSALSYFLYSATGLLVLAQDTGTGSTGWFDGAWDPIAAGATGPQVLTWRLPGGGTGEMWRGSTSLGTAAFTATDMGGAGALGSDPGTPTRAADVAIGRFLAFNALHDAAARSRVWAWGGGAFGL